MTDRQLRGCMTIPLLISAWSMYVPSLISPPFDLHTPTTTPTMAHTTTANTPTTTAPTNAHKRRGPSRRPRLTTTTSQTSLFNDVKNQVQSGVNVTVNHPGLAGLAGLAGRRVHRSLFKRSAVHFSHTTSCPLPPEGALCQVRHDRTAGSVVNSLAAAERW